MKGFQIKLIAFTVFLGMFGSGSAVQTAQAGGGRFFLSFVNCVKKRIADANTRQARILGPVIRITCIAADAVMPGCERGFINAMSTIAIM